MFDDGYSKDIEILSKAQTKMLKPFPFDDEWLFFVYKNKKRVMLPKRAAGLTNKRLNIC